MREGSREGLLGKYKKKIVSFIHIRHLYFDTGRDEITNINLRILLEGSFCAAILTCIFMLVTPFFVGEWEPTLGHTLIAPVCVLFWLISSWYDRRQVKSGKVVNTICYIFIACVMVLIINVDGMLYPDEPAAFIQGVMIMIPSVFMLHLRMIYAEMIGFEVIYMVIVNKYKNPVMAADDCFSSVVGLVISFFLACIIQWLRAENFSAKSQYKKLSMIDGLTGILNKVNCESMIRQYLEEKRRGEHCALLIMDVDNFKNINDTMGHQKGDDVLEKIGEVILETFRGTDILGRFGGDEFLILMKNIPDEHMILKKCQILKENIQGLQKVFQYDLTCSAGIVYDDSDASTYEILFEAADDLLYQAKSTGKDRVELRRISKLEKKKQGKDRPLILLADDNEVNREVLKSELGSKFDIVEAVNGREALEQISIYKHDLSVILLDLISVC